MYFIKSFLNIFRYDFFKNRKTYLFFMIFTFSLSLVSFLIFTYLFGVKDYSLVYLAILSISFLIIGFRILLDEFSILHNNLKNINYLSLPMGSFERYFFILLKVLVLFPLAYYFVFTSSTFLINLLDSLLKGEVISYYFDLIVKNFSHILRTYIFYLSSCSFLVLGSLTFKRMPLVKTVIFAYLFFSVYYVVLFSLIFKILGIQSQNEESVLNALKAFKEADYSKLYADKILVIFIYVVGFFKFKEFEVKG